MEIQGRIVQVMPTASGESRGKTWQRQDFIIETLGQYPKKVCLQLFGDRVNQHPLSIGLDVKVSYDLESREYNGRWYTSVTAWKVEYAGNDNNIPQVPPPPVDSYPAPDDKLPI